MQAQGFGQRPGVCCPSDPCESPGGCGGSQRHRRQVQARALGQRSGARYPGRSEPVVKVTAAAEIVSDTAKFRIRSMASKDADKAKDKVKEKPKDKSKAEAKPKGDAKPKAEGKPKEKDKDKEKGKVKEGGDAAAKEVKEEKPKAPPRPPADPRLKVLKKFHGKFLPRGPLRDRHKTLMDRWNSGEDHGGVTLDELKSLHNDWKTAREKPSKKKADAPV